MKLLSVNLARSIWLFSIQELNPRGKSLYSAIPLLLKLYNFKKMTPQPPEILDFSKGIKFEEGEFRNKQGEIIDISFTAYNDGITVDTRSSTKDSDDFLHEMLRKLSEEFKLINYKQIDIKNKYISQLYFTTENKLELLNPRLKDFSECIGQIISHPYELGSISFWADHTKGINPPHFTFERVMNVPFSENKYFSSSGLQTDNHLELLDKLENIISGS